MVPLAGLDRDDDVPNRVVALDELVRDRNVVEREAAGGPQAAGSTPAPSVKKVGVVADLNTTEWNSYIQKGIVRPDDTAEVNRWVYPSDPDVFPYYHSSAAGKGFNIRGLQDAKLDDILVREQSTRRSSAPWASTGPSASATSRGSPPRCTATSGCR